MRRSRLVVAYCSLGTLLIAALLLVPRDGPTPSEVVASPAGSSTPPVSASPGVGAPRVVYVMFHPAVLTIDVLEHDLASGTSRRVTSVPLHRRGYGAGVWISPLGTKVAVNEAMDPRRALTIVSVDSGDVVHVDEKVVIAPSDFPLWSDDDATVTYARGVAEGMAVVEASSDGARRRQLTATSGIIARIGRSSRGVVAERFDGSGRSLVLLRPDGSVEVLTRLAKEASVPMQYAGDLLAFYHYEEGAAGVAVIDLAVPSAPTMVARGADLDSNYAISRAGTVLVVSDLAAYASGVSRVKRVDLETGGITYVPTVAGRFAQPVAGRTWSRDGQWLAFESDKSGIPHRTRGIEIMRSDGTDARVLSPPAGGSLSLVGWR